MKKYMEK